MNTARVKIVHTACIAASLIMMTLLSSCSNKQVYEAIQDSQKIECQKLPDSQYEECLQRLSKPYEQYESDRQEAVKK